MALKANYMHIALSIVYMFSLSLEHEMCFPTAYLTYPFGCIAEMNLKFNIIQIDLLIFSSRSPQINTKQINLPNLFLFQIHSAGPIMT